MLPDDWTGLAQVLVIGPSAYLALVLLLRASGKRTLTKLNMFDFVVTVALGSTLASVILTKSVGLVQGIAAFAVLIGLQYGITWLAVRWPAFEGVIKAEPALRAQGKGEAAGVAAIVLETDGTLTVIAEGRAGAGTLDFHRKGDTA